MLPSKSKCSTFCLIIASVLLGGGCQKKAEIQAQTNECATKVSELTGVIKALDAEILATNLGPYNNPHKPQIDELASRIPLIKQETARLKTKLEEQKKVVEQAEKALNDYRDKYGN